jgi:hypothetical protein
MHYQINVRETGRSNQEYIIQCDIYGDRREAKVTKYKERGKIQPFTSIAHERETDKRVD